MPVRMTETAINKAIREVSNGTRRDLADAGCPGLRLRLTPAGAATWVLACRDRQGRMRRFPLGRYPDKGISEARSEARALHTRVKQDGADPVAERRRERAMGAAAKAGVGTLAALLDLYGRSGVTLRRRWAEARKRIDLVFKPLLAKPVATLRRQISRCWLTDTPSRIAAGFAVRSVRPALKWAATAWLSSLRRLRASHPPAPVQAPQAHPDPRRTRGGAASAADVQPPLRRRAAVHAADPDPPAGNRPGPLARREHGGADLDHPRDEERRAARRAPVPAGDRPAAVPTADRRRRQPQAAGPERARSSPRPPAHRSATGIARRRRCKRPAAPRAGPATICAAPARRCSAKWASCRTSSRRR